MRRYKKRAAAGVLAAALLCTGQGGAFAAFGGEPQVDVDETMYVNLDYYGKTSKINVVKGCDLNGNTSFTDYGSYERVINMSNEAVPQIGEDSVQWELPADEDGRFYYQCSMSGEQVTLPWDFDVSYKHNGVPADARDLAGASGVVEIHVQAVPNEGAKEYYRNNMLLMVAVPVDMEECYSLEAEGAQIQSLGSMSTAVFTALPGEEGDYTVRIGSDSFESVGVVMAMVPGTVEDLEHIKDLKEAKDTWQDAGDALYDSLEQMAQAVEGMRGGIDSLRSGVQSGEEVRQQWSGSKDAILAENDEALAALGEMSSQLSAMVPHLESAKDQAQVIHEGMGNIVDVMGEMQEPLAKLYTRLRNIEGDMGSLEKELPQIQQLMLQIVALDAQFQANEQTILTALGTIEAEIEEAEELYYEEEGEETSGGQEDSQDAGGAGEALPGKATLSDAGRLLQEPDGLHPATLSRHDAPLLGSSMGDILDMLKQKAALLEKAADQSGRLASSLSSLAGDTGEAAKYSQDLVDSVSYLIEDITALQDSLDTYYPEVQSAISDSAELVSRTTDALNSGVNAMTLLQDTLKATSGGFDAAARDSLKGSMELLDQSLKVIDSTTSIRQAGRTMKDVMDSELDKFDTENRFLYIDPSAPKVSFTSEKNREPNTLQVVLRTEEISLEDEEDQMMDAEEEKEQESPFKRMWDVLVKMWNAVVEIFKGR